MALDVSALGNYVKDNEKILITAALTGGKTSKILMSEGNVIKGIKTSERIGVLDTEVVFQNGDGCGFNPAGDTKITQRTLTVGNVKIEDSICVPVLEKKYTQLMMQAGTNNDKLPPVIEEVYTSRKVAKIRSAIEKADWQGDTNSGDPNLNKYDGFNKIINTSIGLIAANAKRGAGTITAGTGSATVTGVSSQFSSRVAVGDKLYSAGVLVGTVQAVGSDTSITLTGNAAVAVTAGAYTIVPASVAAPITSVTGVTVANIRGIIDSIILAIPQDVYGDEDEGAEDSDGLKGSPIIFMGWEYAKMYLMAMQNANLFHVTTEKGMLKNGFEVPGFGVRVMPTKGLNGTGQINVLSPKNMWLGVDLEHEEEQMDIWYEKKDDAILSRTRFKRGVQIGFPDEVAVWIAA